MLYRGSLPYFLLLLGLRISFVIPRTSIFIWGLLYRGSTVVSSEYRSIHWSLNVVLHCKLLGLKEEMTLIKIVTDNHYYSFKIFLRFWLAKIPRIIHHNQLLSTTNLEELYEMWTDDVNRAAKLPRYWTVTREDLGTRMSCFGSEYKMYEHFTRFTRTKKGKLLAINVARIARRQLDGRHLRICYLENICKTEQLFIS